MSISNSTMDKIVVAKDLPFTPEPGGVGKMLFSKMAEGGSTVAQVHGYTGQTDTYQALLQRCVRTAIAMRNMGISHNDVISICSHHHFDNIVPLIASFFIGAISANLDPGFSTTITSTLISQVQPKLIFVGAEALEFIENCIRKSRYSAKIILFGNSTTYLEFSKLTLPIDDEDTFTPVEANLKTTALISFTSGTTGVPKGVSLSHWSVLCQALSFHNAGYNLERYLQFTSLYWNTILIRLIGCFIHNGCRVVVPSFDINKVWNVLSKTKVTTMFIPKNRALLMSKQRRPENMYTHLEALIVTGSYVDEQLLSDLEDMVPEAKIVVSYGLTETCGPCMNFTANSVGNKKKNAASIGRALPGFSFRVVDPDTEEVHGPYQEGELRVKSNILMTGYYKKNSDGVWDSEGWLKTGDIVYYDDNMYFYVTERMKEVIKFQHCKIYPTSIENVLNRCPGVDTCVVVGKPHPTDENQLVGIVVLKQDAREDVNAQYIRKYVEDRVDEHKRLQGGVKIVSCIPVTPSGKINRLLIKEMLINGKI